MIRGSLPIVFCQEWLLHRVFWTAAAGMGSGWASYFKAKSSGNCCWKKFASSTARPLSVYLNPHTIGWQGFPKSQKYPNATTICPADYKKTKFSKKKIENLDFLCNPLDLWNKVVQWGYFWLLEKTCHPNILLAHCTFRTFLPHFAYLASYSDSRSKVILWSFGHLPTLQTLLGGPNNDNEQKHGTNMERWRMCSFRQKYDPFHGFYDTLKYLSPLSKRPLLLRTAP